MPHIRFQPLLPAYPSHDAAAAAEQCRSGRRRRCFIITTCSSVCRRRCGQRRTPGSSGSWCAWSRTVSPPLPCCCPGCSCASACSWRCAAHRGSRSAVVLAHHCSFSICGRRHQVPGPSLRLNTQASLEPPQLSRHRMQLHFWGPVIAAVETLVLRCGALECVLEGREPLLNAARLQHVLGAHFLSQVHICFSSTGACRAQRGFISCCMESRAAAQCCPPAARVK